MSRARHGTRPSPEPRAKIPVAAARASLPQVISLDGASSPMGVSPAVRVPGKCILVNVHRFQAGVPRTHARRSTRARTWRPRPSGSRCASRAHPVRAQVGEVGVAAQVPERGCDRTVGLDRRSRREHKRTATYVCTWRPRPSGSRCASRAAGQGRSAWRPNSRSVATTVPWDWTDGHTASTRGRLPIAPAPTTTASALGA